MHIKVFLHLCTYNIYGMFVKCTNVMWCLVKDKMSILSHFMNGDILHNIYINLLLSTAEGGLADWST